MRDVCGSIKVRRKKNSRGEWWNDVVNVAVVRKEVASKDALGANSEIVRERRI